MVKPNRADPSEPALLSAKVSRVLIVDDHELLRDGMRLMIGSEPDLEICGEAADEAEARRKVDQLAPTLVVVDISLAEGNGIELVKWIKKHHPETKTIVATMHDEKVYGERVIRAGAHGYVDKQYPARTLLEAIRHVIAGKLHFSEALISKVMQRIGGGGELSDSPIDALSDRELEVFRLIGGGQTTGAIAKELHLSPSTVDTYRERVKTKLGLHTGAELTHYATQWFLENR